MQGLHEQIEEKMVTNMLPQLPENAVSVCDLTQFFRKPVRIADLILLADCPVPAYCCRLEGVILP
jgi:hypothetical protein